MADVLIGEILALEHEVWQALLSGDATVDAGLLDDGFLGVYETGYSDKAGHVGQLAAGATVARYELDDIRMIVPGAGLALLCYRADFWRVGASAREAMYVSSLWRQQPEGWRNIFSQDTAVGGRAPV